MPTDMTGLLSVSRAEGKQAAQTLARAFYDYSLLRYYYPDDEKREKIAYYSSASNVYTGTYRGEVYTTSVNMEGVAVWILSDYYAITFSRMIRSVPFPVILGLLRNGFKQLQPVGEYLDTTHERLAPFKHMYLLMIGVDPQHQGKGHAGKLIKPMLVRLDEEKMPCYLDTLDKKNVSLYEHLGFKLIEESTIPGTPLTCWAMLREPGK
jgi:ribosomal protein S18 acetylase RimI-like enzyme